MGVILGMETSNELDMPLKITFKNNRTIKVLYSCNAESEIGLQKQLLEILEKHTILAYEFRTQEPIIINTFDIQTVTVFRI